MQEKDIIHSKPYLKVYPNPEDVFTSPTDRYFHHLLPLISIDLSVVNAELLNFSITSTSLRLYKL